MLTLLALSSSPALSLAIICSLFAGIYVIYQRCFHPLAKFSGPILASLTNGIKCSYFLSLQIDQKISALHDKYGSVVRIGPNELSFCEPEAVNAIFKSGRSMVKGRFYNGFTAFKPNLFGVQDEDVRKSRTVADPSLTTT